MGLMDNIKKAQESVELEDARAMTPRSITT